MRILVLAPQPFWTPRGTPIAVRLLATELAAAGHRLDLLTYHEGADVAIEGCCLRRIASPPGVRDVPPSFSWKKLVCDAALGAEAYRLARDRRFDLVHAVEESAFVALGLKRAFGLPYVYDMDSTLAGQMIDKFPALGAARGLLEAAERLAVRESAGVLAVCESLAARARAHAPGGLVGRLEDPSLLDGAAGSPARSVTVEPLAARVGEGPIVLYVGNLEPYQGIDLLLEAFARIATPAPHARLAVIGGAAPQIERYQARAVALGLDRVAHFVGPRPLEALGGYLAQAAVLVSPRIQGDNTAMKVYSYMDSGRPIVATRLPTHTQVLDDATAVLVEPAAGALAAGLLGLLEDPGRGQRLAAAAAARVRREHGHDAWRQKLLGFYRTLEARLFAGRE